MATRVSTVIDQAQRLVNRADPNLRSAALEAVNRAVRRWASARPWDALKTYEDFISDGTRLMALPERVRIPISVSDASRLEPIKPGGQWHRTHPTYWLQNQAAGLAYEWRALETQPVIAQPVTDTTLRVEAGVSEVITVYFEGLVRDTNASGTALELYTVREAFVVSGTGYSNTTHKFVEVHQIEKDVTLAASDLKVSSDVDEKLLARIFADERSPEYRMIEFLALPTAGNRIRVEYYRRPRKVTSESDTIPAPVNEEYLVWRVVGDLHWLENSPEQAQLAWRKADGLMAEHQISEEAHGERSDPIMPDYRYLDMEGDSLYDGGW